MVYVLSVVLVERVFRGYELGWLPWEHHFGLGTYISS